MGEMLYHANFNQNKAVVAILILYEVNFNAKNITRNKKDYFLKCSIHQKNKIILNFYASNIIVSKYMRQTLIEL